MKLKIAVFILDILKSFVNSRSLISIKSLSLSNLIFLKSKDLFLFNLPFNFKLVSDRSLVL